MQRSHRMLTAALLALTALASLTPSVALARDWPEWLGPDREGVWRETGLVDKFPAGAAGRVAQAHWRRI